jgi:hypothetical protein
MMEKNKDLPTPHPFMANSAEASFNELLKVANVTDIDELFEQIPKDHIFKGDWNFDPAMPSEAAIYKHLTKILRKNISAEDNLNFLGAGPVIKMNGDIWKFLWFIPGKDDATFVNAKGTQYTFNPKTIYYSDKRDDIMRMEEIIEDADDINVEIIDYK